jgi:putative selenium metabolism hydrolase
MEVKITTTGEATHGSSPDRGQNAIYAMAPIVAALSDFHNQLDTTHPMLGPGSAAVTEIQSRSPSLTAIPDECSIHLDRRLTIGESPQAAQAQLEAMREVERVGARVEILEYSRPSWRGFTFTTRKVFPAWETPEESAAVRAAMTTARQVLGREPRIHRSTFSSSGCATAGLFQIPTVGFGPGDEVHSHSVEDQISLAQLEPAMAFYGLFPKVYASTEAP